MNTVSFLWRMFCYRVPKEMNMKRWPLLKLHMVHSMRKQSIFAGVRQFVAALNKKYLCCKVRFLIL